MTADGDLPKLFNFRELALNLQFLGGCFNDLFAIVSMLMQLQFHAVIEAKFGVVWLYVLDLTHTSETLPVAVAHSIRV